VIHFQAGRIDEEQKTVSRRHSLSPNCSQKLVSLLDEEQTSLARRREGDNTLSLNKLSLGLKEHKLPNPTKGSQSFLRTVPIIQAVIKFKKPLCKCNVKQPPNMESVKIPAIKLIPSSPVRHGAGLASHSSLPEVDNDSQINRKHGENKHDRSKARYRDRRRKYK
jgi:hypothetical protein